MKAPGKRALAVLGLVGWAICCAELRAKAADYLTLSQSALGNIFLTTETVQIPVATTADTVAWTVRDFAGNTTTGTATSVGASHQAVVHPLSGRPGYFELHLDARRAGITVAQADTTYAVVPPVNVSRMADSPFGVMTHFAQTWDRDLIPLIARAGLRHIRDEQYWDTVETVRGQYAFNDSYTGYMAAAAQNGLEPLLELTFGNKLYDHDPAAPDTAWAPVTDAGREGYADYALALLAKYGRQVPSVEVWNEYNGGFCPGPAADNRAAYYTRMLRVAYEAIKARRPEVRVLGGAAVLAPQPWFEDLFAAGALDYMDAAVIHSYFAVPEDVEKNVLAIQDSMARYNHGAGPKPIWATETALADPTHPGRQDMARNLVRLLTVMRTVGVERIYWYLMRDYNDFTTGLLHSDRDPLGRYTPTSAYPAYATLIQQLYRARFVRREATDLRTRLYLFDQGGADLRVLWSVAPPSRILLKTDQPVTMVDLMGVTQVLKPQNGTILLTVNNDPLYLRGHVDSVREIGRDLLLADSVDGFNGVQGTTPGTWSYGYYVAGPGAYHPEQFHGMNWTRTDWDYRWQCPYAYAAVTNTIQHPSYAGDTPVWIIRRWRSSATGTAHLSGTAGHASDGGDGDGIKVFVDGKEVFSGSVGTSGGPNGLSFDLSVPVQVGSLVDFVVTPGPGADINFDTVDYRSQVTMPAPGFPTSFNDWQRQFFTPEGLADPAISGDAADPLGDGMCNLLKYAFGFAPGFEASAQQPAAQLQTVDSERYLTLSFRRLLASTDLSYTVEVADTPADDQWVPGGVVVGTTFDNGDGTETVTYRDDQPAVTAAQRFMRLSITRTEAVNRERNQSTGRKSSPARG